MRGDISNPLSINQYTYCWNNPLIYADPSGNIPVETAVDIASIGWSANDFRNDPSLGNFGYLLWDIGSAFLPYIPGSYVVKGFKFVGKADSAIDATKAVKGTGGAEKLYHYTSANPESILKNGLQPGSSGKVFTTPAGNLSPLQAQLDLALPPNRGLPQNLLEIDVQTLKNMGIEIPQGQQVTRMFNMPGGGTEVVFPHAIPSEAIRWVK